jgi:hypothetical protein
MAAGYSGRRLLRLTGVLLQTFVPMVLLALMILDVWLLSAWHLKGRDWEATFVFMGMAFPGAAIYWSTIRGKKLYWLGSWTFSYHHAEFPDMMHDDNWGDARETSSVNKSKMRGARLWLAGWLCCLASLGIVFGGVRLVLDSYSRLLILTAGEAMVSIGIGAFGLSRNLFVTARRHRAQIIPSSKMLPMGSYVLYLRPFEIDKRRTALQRQGSYGGVGQIARILVSNHDEEEQIADAMRPVGSLIAVGTPGERLPYAGAVRMYMPKEADAWHQPVSQLIEGARLVILTLGVSEGTLWELAEAMRILSPQRLIVMVPEWMSREHYEAIRAENGARRTHGHSAKNKTWKRIAPSALPAYPNSTGISPIHFSAGWEPAVARLPAVAPPMRNLFTSLIRGLRPVFEQLAAHEEQTGRHCSIVESQATRLQHHQPLPNQKRLRPRRDIPSQSSG